MDERLTIVNRYNQISRPIRSKRQSKKTFIDGERPPKRLFTPEIKKYLKDWLIRRRDNPYPNRDEKKILAMETGLTYIQICNWFANWRRKLKSTGKTATLNSWGHLIKTYNDQASGNIEQFSICSDDSIWEESNSPKLVAEDLTLKKNDRGYCEEKISALNLQDHSQCFTISSTTEDAKSPQSNKTCRSPNSINKYKNNIMEKYLKGLQSDNDKTSENDQPLQLTKWLVSAAKFQPSQNNYSIWNSERHSKTLYQNNIPKTTNKCNSISVSNNTAQNNDLKKPTMKDMLLNKNIKDVLSMNNENMLEHGLEEVEAAVALTRLAGLYKSL